MKRWRTQVGIVGAGPAGLLLSQLLATRGIDSIVLERRDRAYVEGRVRAGVLEQGTIDLLHEAGVAERLDREGLRHHGISIALHGQRHPIDFPALTGGKSITVYGQTEVTKDLIAARLSRGGDLRFEAESVTLHDLDTERPSLSFEHEGDYHEIACDFIAGCDGYHGVCRGYLPPDKAAALERDYPFAWLGILADAPPVDENLIYCRHERGFALFSMRSRTRSRHYLQCRPDENLQEWSDDRIWSELRTRLGKAGGDALQPGPLLEKSVTPMRSFVVEPLRHGRLFLAGDSGHIVPPTGAKGLNLAASDVHYLVEALDSWYRAKDARGLDAYSATALARVWKAQRFSWWMTSLLHVFGDGFQDRIHLAELEYLLSSKAALATLAENYVGLPF